MEACESHAEDYYGTESVNQLQDWMGLLMPDDVYHVHGRAI